MLRRWTPLILGSDRKPYPGSIARLDRIPVGGVEQWVLVRGVDAQQPLILLVPDGPGESLIPLAREVQGELERAFIVANWDPRGTGLSYDPRTPESALTLDRLADDTVEVARWLGGTFGRDRIVLAGHGFGSVVAILAAQRAPALFESYIGVGQWVEPAESDRRGLAWALAQATKEGPPRLREALEAASNAPEDDPGRRTVADRAIAKLGGEVEIPEGRDRRRIHFGKLAEYTLFDALRQRRAAHRAARALAGEARRVDLPRRVTRLEIPTFFVAGRSDHVVDPELAREYLRVLDAPRKGWAWIEGTAHLAPFEDPEAYAAALAHFAHDARGPTGPNWTIAG